MGKKIDYTKKKDLPVCPECGRHGKKKVHTIKGKKVIIFNHKSEIVLGFNSVRDRCIL